MFVSTLPGDARRSVAGSRPRAISFYQNKSSARCARLVGPAIGVGICFVSIGSYAAPPPSGPHPRLFMSSAETAAYTQNAKSKDSAAAGLVAACEDTIASPGEYAMRGGSDGNLWPAAAVNCAFAYRVTNDSRYLTQAIKYWHASLDDDQTLGDGAGCRPGVDTNWKGWNGSPPAPPVIATVTHDTDYPMRWYGPDVALTYDWLSGAPGVDAALLGQTRTCLGAWVDFYTAGGYHNEESGSNYNAGYVIAKTFAAIAFGDEGGDSHLWDETTATLFPSLIVGKGLAGMSGMLGTPAGSMVGGDWAEGWQYGPLSVLEYAVAARSLADAGAPQADMAPWANSLVVRYVYATVPTGDGQWVGGDFDSDKVYQSPSANELDAVLAGPSNDVAAGWAAFVKKSQALPAGPYVYNAFAEARAAAPSDFTATSPPPPPWYLARGTRALYARTSWKPDAFWSVFSSAPKLVSDHQHLSASNFVFSRGADHLVVDPSNYGEPGTLETNAVTADSKGVGGEYAPSQTPWSTAELTWARATADGVYAARSDFAGAFIYDDKPSDINYAHREWVMLPEGEIVTIDRVLTVDAAHKMYVGFHANTGGGKLALNGTTATGPVGDSTISIHAVHLSGGVPTVTARKGGACAISCDYPCGECDAARFAVDKYAVEVPGPWAVAVHVIDGLGPSEKALVGSLNDDPYDPAPKQNAGVIGAAVNRGAKQSYVVASAAQKGASGATMTYEVAGDGASRHVVFDAPEGADATSKVEASVREGRCAISITASGALTGRPLMFSIGAASGGCVVSAETEIPPGSVPVGTGGTTGSGAAAGGDTTGAGGTSGAIGGGGTRGGAGGVGQPADAADAESDDGGGCALRGARRDAGIGGAALAILAGMIARRRRSALVPPGAVGAG